MVAPDAVPHFHGEIEFVPIQEGLFGSFHAWRSDRAGSDRLMVRDSLGIQFVKTGRVRQRLSGHGRYVYSGARVSLTTFPGEVRQERAYEAGEDVNYVGVWVDPKVMIEAFGVQPDRLPEPLRSFFRGEANSPASMSLPLSSRLWMALDDIFENTFQGPLRQTYLKAKITELVAEVAGSLERISEMGQRNGSSGLTQHELMKIEAAALIYARSLNAPPSIEDMSRLVGLNRNKLGLGFHDLFDCSPHAYSRRLRMNWARRSLEDRSMCLHKIAEQVGYSTPSAFTRAFAEHFNMSPSQMRRAMSESEAR